MVQCGKTNSKHHPWASGRWWRELARFKVIQDVGDGKHKLWRAAERMELTTRQVRRLVARLREHGPAGLATRH
ncbi:helix-turn-helix domain-containing protein [Burkholderia aenigmatica]|nr:helix-turn-helix domain-containing protein [Burkholderia aenigmatica]MDN7874924.1 helix-turn-helix domain-containing protein [Burkholderia aenigmatica]